MSCAHFESPHNFVLLMGSASSNKAKGLRWQNKTITIPLQRHHVPQATDTSSSPIIQTKRLYRTIFILCLRTGCSGFYGCALRQTPGSASSAKAAIHDLRATSSQSKDQQCNCG
eukprot:569073-Amphidinium_carterae.2